VFNQNLNRGFVLFELTPANEISVLDPYERTLGRCCIDPLRPPGLSECGNPPKAVSAVHFWRHFFQSIYFLAEINAAPLTSARAIRNEATDFTVNSRLPVRYATEIVPQLNRMNHCFLVKTCRIPLIARMGE